MNLYPRSFLRLILVGWLLTALPLMIALAFASVSLTRLTARGETFSQQTTEATRLSRQLDEGIRLLERLVLQYDALRDPSLIEDYQETRATWLRAHAELARIPLLAPLAPRMDQMRAQEAEVYRLLRERPEQIEPIQAFLTEILNGTTHLIDDIGKTIEAEQQAFRGEAEELQGQLLIAIPFAFLLAAALFWGGQRIVAQLFAGVERAVIALGNNLLDRPIHLKGTDDLRWIGKRLDWLRKRMQSLEEARTRVLRHVSHELKTPLAALREGSSLISEGVAGPLTDQQAKIAGIMQTNVARLQALIDGLLKLQQAEHARERIDLEHLRLDEIIQRSLATHELTAREKRLHISGRLSPLTVEGGREEITAIVDNLISNAIKFSPPKGAIRVSLGRDGSRAVLDVIDDGPGVPEEDQKMIFEPFYRGPGTKSVAGIGLGLALAREYVQVHHGTLDYLSDAEKTHFRATLPLAASLS